MAIKLEYGEINRDHWLEYLGERQGTYEWRCLRYAAVWEQMQWLGVQPHDLVVDVGAGMCDFDRYIRQVQNWDGRYLPVDGSIDGTDIEDWSPSISADFFVAIELMEHLFNPIRLLGELEIAAEKGVVITTPNPENTDVMAMDRTHHFAIWPQMLEDRGWNVYRRNLFGKGDDTLVAHYNRIY